MSFVIFVVDYLISSLKDIDRAPGFDQSLNQVRQHRIPCVTTKDTKSTKKELGFRLSSPPRGGEELEVRGDASSSDPPLNFEDPCLMRRSAYPASSSPSPSPPDPSPALGRGESPEFRFFYSFTLPLSPFRLFRLSPFPLFPFFPLLL